MPGLSKKHWLGNVLKNWEPALNERLTPETPPLDVWEIAEMVSGLTPGQLAKAVATYFKITVADLNAADLRILKLIPEKLARRYLVFPIRQDDRYLYVATSEPGNLQAEQAIAFTSSRSTVFQVASPQAIEQALNQQYSPFEFQSSRQPGVQGIQQSEPANSSTIGTIAFASATPPVFHPEASAANLKTADVWGDTEEDTVSKEQPHILIVDDDSVTRRLAWSILAKQGYSLMEASDGIEALATVSTGTPLSLIVLDLDMPRLGGREVLKKLKSSAATSALPVIVLTASPEEADEAQLMEEGADDYIRKPLEPARFTARVKAVLRRATA